jgi:hypothetical protein
MRSAPHPRTESGIQAQLTRSVNPPACVCTGWGHQTDDSYRLDSPRMPLTQSVIGSMFFHPAGSNGLPKLAGAGLVTYAKTRRTGVGTVSNHA